MPALIPEPAFEMRYPMSAERFYFCQRCIGWTDGEMARRLQIDESSVRRMRKGWKFIPRAVAIWLEHLAAIHRAMPQPPGWGVDKEMKREFPTITLEPEQTYWVNNTRLISDEPPALNGDWGNKASEPDELDMLNELEG